MNITPLKTGLVSASSSNIEKVLAGALDRVPERCVVAVSSKIVALCEGSVVGPDECGRDELIEREADLYLPGSGNPYGVYLTIKGGTLIPNAGVDESNAGGCYALWPRDPMRSAAGCWRFLRERYRVREIGIVITDSTDTPLKWGVTGICIGYCGFSAVNDRIGARDLFGRALAMTKVNVADALAAAATLCMGEADEQTPVALIEELPFVRFADAPPTEEEQSETRIDSREDVFGPLLRAASWRRGIGR